MLWVAKNYIGLDRFL